MKTLRQWINWRLVPVSGQVKPAKVPYSHEERRNINAHDSNNWLTYQEAKANSEHVGFVLTGKDGYFCVDVDDCLIDGEWSEHSLRILSWFPGAYVEVSHSGKGLHIFGFSHGEVPSHKKKRKFADGEVELYTEKRSIAFSEQGCRGDYNCDLTTQLCDFIQNVMSPEPETHGGSGGSVTAGDENQGYGEWQKPDERWHGPTDDAELIEKMLSSRGSVISLLNGKASIGDLWSKNISVLAENYPDPTDKGRPYDDSSADMALMAHLAFWTGKDLPRMIKLARMSSLGRPKWDSNKEYLSRTGGTACKRCENVYGSKSADENDSNPTTGSRFLSIDAQKELFKGCVYISESRCIFVHNHGMMSPDQFNDWLPGATFALTHDGKLTTKKAFDAFVSSQAHDFPKVERSCFRPMLKPGEIIDIQGTTYVNTYVPVNIRYGTGSVEMFLFLLGVLFPKKQDYDVILNYMAACVQYPGVKFRWCPVIQGVQGNGKSLLGKCLAYAIGKKYVFYAQANDIANKFNGWMERRLLIIVNEIFTTDKRETIDTLKDMIAEDEIAVQPKGQETRMIDNFANFYMTTNHKDAMGKLKNERRYFMIYTPQQQKEHLTRDGLTEDFFNKYGSWLSSGGYDDIAGYLMQYKIEDNLNPTKEALVAPESSSKEESIDISRGKAYEEVQEAINQGLKGFRGGWVSSYWLAEFFKDGKINVNRNKRGDLMAELGYVPMPWYADGRSSTRIVIDENVKSVLYIKESMQYGAAKTTSDYINAQACDDVKPQVCDDPPPSPSPMT